MNFRVRCCGMQGKERHRWRGVQLAVGAGIGRGEAGRPRATVGPRKAERQGKDERSWAFRRRAEAADAANPLWAAVR